MTTVATSHAMGAGLIVIRRTKLTGGMLQTTNTSFTLTSTSIVRVGNLLQIDDEIMQVRSLVGQVVGVDRGKAATSITVHDDGVTATVLSIATINAPHLNMTLGGLSKESTQINVTSPVAMKVTRAGQFIRVGYEVMLVTGIGAVADGGSILNVARGAAGTSATLHSHGDRAELASGATLKVALSTTDASILISSQYDLVGNLLQNSQVQIALEVMLVTQMSVSAACTLLTVERGHAATTATTHAFEASVFLIQSTLLAFGSEMKAVDTIVNLESSLGIQNVGGLSTGGYIQIENEVMRIVTGANTALNNLITVERAQLGSAAQPHQDGTPITIPRTTYLRDSMLTSAQDFAVVSSPAAIGLSVGSYFKMDTEILMVTEVRGFNVSIARGQLGTVAKIHEEGTFAIPWQSCRLEMD